jgi:hypothetical protein
MLSQPLIQLVEYRYTFLLPSLINFSHGERFDLPLYHVQLLDKAQCHIRFTYLAFRCFGLPIFGFTEFSPCVIQTSYIDEVVFLTHLVISGIAISLLITMGKTIK